MGGGERQLAEAGWTTPAIVDTICGGAVIEFGLVNVEQEPVSGDGMSDLAEAGEFLCAHAEMLAEECVGIGWLRPNLEGGKSPQARIPFGFPLASDEELRAVTEEEYGEAANRGDGAWSGAGKIGGTAQAGGQTNSFGADKRRSAEIWDCRSSRRVPSGPG